MKAAIFKRWFMRLRTILSEDNRIKIIHPLSSTYDSLAVSMLTWAPMHVTGRTTAYIIPREKDEQLISTYFLVKDQLALHNWTTRQSTRELNTYITHEPQLVKDIEVMLQCRFDESTRIFEQFNYEAKDAYINSLVAALERITTSFTGVCRFRSVICPKGCSARS